MRYIFLLLIISSCAVSKPQERKFIVTSTSERTMILDRKYKVPKCDTCKVGDLITAFKIGK